MPGGTFNTAYGSLAPEKSAQNLSNRVAYTMVFDYDLQSGKVNKVDKVVYQHGYYLRLDGTDPDELYARYIHPRTICQILRRLVLAIIIAAVATTMAAVIVVVIRPMIVVINNKMDESSTTFTNQGSTYNIDLPGCFSIGLCIFLHHRWRKRESSTHEKSSIFERSNSGKHLGAYEGSRDMVDKLYLQDKRPGI